MKLRRMARLGVGVAIGAGAMYVLDPDAGRRRRRDVAVAAGRAAVRRVRREPPRDEVRREPAREEALAAGKRVARTVGRLAASARDGFHDGRQTA